jgi:hypothetical protein
MRLLVLRVCQRVLGCHLPTLHLISRTSPLSHSEASRTLKCLRDELTLALNLDMQTGGNPTTKDDAALEALSSDLDKMHRLNGGGEIVGLRCM